MNFEALFKISYGLYIVSSGHKEKGNGYIANTVFQVTSSPAQFATCCNKDNYTCQMIEESGCFAATILHKNTKRELFSTFGYKSGTELDKLTGMDVSYGKTGAPIVLNDAVAYLECKVVQKFDVGTHYLFIGELVDAQIVDDKLDPITYDYYRNVNKSAAPKNAPTYVDKSKLETKEEAPAKEASVEHRCAICSFTYNDAEEGDKFDNLPGDWTCPVCGASKDEFMEV